MKLASTTPPVAFSQWPVPTRSAALLSGLLTVALTGCFRFDLPLTTRTTPSSSSHSALAANALPPGDMLQSRPLSVCLSAPIEDTVVGSQYVVGLLPVTRVHSSGIHPYFVDAVSRWGQKRGLKLSFSCTSPQLTLVINSLRVSAFDLLLVRYLSSAVSVSVTRADRPTVVITGSASAWRRYGFARQLQAVLDDATDAVFADYRFTELAL